MIDPVQILSVVISASLLLLVLELVRRRHLGEEHSFIWIGGAVFLLIISFWRRSLDTVAFWLGVHYPPALLLLALVFFVFIALLYFSTVASRQRRQIELLVEETALLDARLRALTARIDARDEQASQPETEASQSDRQ